MKRFLFAAIAMVALSAAGTRAGEVTFVASDGVTVFADVYNDAGADAPIVVLFHQAGANARAEYVNIIPRLVEHGYNVLAVDQRSGGDRLGGSNRTVDKLDKKNHHYCDAYPDLEAAVAYAVDEKLGGPLFVWGSSYSAALVIHLGVDHADVVSGVLAFSPASGEPMKTCDPTDAIAKIEVPLLALRPAGEMEHERVRKQLETIKGHGHGTFVAENGVHGSSMLNPDRVEGDVEATWKAVFDFIDTVAGAQD